MRHLNEGSNLVKIQASQNTTSLLSKALYVLVCNDIMLFNVHNTEQQTSSEAVFWDKHERHSVDYNPTMVNGIWNNG